MTLRQGYQEATGRPVVMGTRGMLAASHYLASAAGYTMLRRGGSAADAAIACNATLSVVYNHMAGLGGDVFALIWDPQSGDVSAMNGSGRSGENATIDRYKAAGGDEIEPRGALAANTVPGVVQGWSKIHDRFGKLDWTELFQPAIEYAANGFPISPKFRDYIHAYRDTLSRFEEASRIFLPGGKAPTAGARFRQPDLAQSLRIIANDGAQAFYEGELAEKLVRGLQDGGGILTLDDLVQHTSDWVDPLRTTYHGYEILEMPPNTQGIATLMLLNLLEEFDLPRLGQGTADYYHLMAEAVKLAFADRDAWVTDPQFLDIPYDKLLDKQRARERAQRIAMDHAAAEQKVQPGVSAHGDTVYMAAVDDDGLAVSLIQSVYFEFGSAYIPPGTGIFMQNRGSFFSLDPDHPNHLQPRKRTFHTIIPALALKDGKPALLFGSMGGEGQPQTQAAMLSRILDFGFNVQEAIEAPRWLYGRTWGAASKSLKLEARVPDGVLVELERRGHDVDILKHYSQSMGHAQAIWIDRENGALHGGADPRGEGLAIGY